MDKPTLLVTGATGFVGSHFVAHALAQGHRVIAVRRSAAASFRIAVRPGAEFLDRSLDMVQGDDFRGVDAMVHLAAEGATARGASAEGCFRTNVVETVGLLQRALASGVRRHVVAGSYAEYGRAGLRFDPIPPDAPLEPTDVYATSKAAACIAICGLCRSQKFQLSYQRIFSAYGDGQYEENFWPALRKAALAGADFKMTEGLQVRDFIPVGDVANRLLREATRSDLIAGVPHVRNLASGEPRALRDYAAKWWKEFGARGELQLGAVPTRPNEVARFVPEVEWPKVP